MHPSIKAAIPRRRTHARPARAAWAWALSWLLWATSSAATLTLDRAKIHVQSQGSMRAACPTERAFVDAVRRALTLPARSESTPPVSVEVAFYADGGGARGAVVVQELDREPSLRNVHGASCREVAEAIGLIVALTIDPLVDLSVPVSIAAPLRAPRRTAAVVTSEPRAPDVPPSPLHFGLGVSAAASHGLLPGLAPAFGTESQARLVAGLRSRAAIGARLFLPVEYEFAGGSIRFAAWQLDLDVCPAQILLAGVEVGACPRATWARVTTTSRGYAENRDTTKGIVMLGMALQARVQVTGQVGLVAQAGASAVLTPAVWQVEGAGAAFDAAEAVSTVALGVAVDF
jgi:hypothetical protein